MSWVAPPPVCRERPSAWKNLPVSNIKLCDGICEEGYGPLPAGVLQYCYSINARFIEMKQRHKVYTVFLRPDISIINSSGDLSQTILVLCCFCRFSQGFLSPLLQRLCKLQKGRSAKFEWASQGCHVSGKSQGKTKFSPGQGIVREFWKNVREFWPFD